MNDYKKIILKNGMTLYYYHDEVMKSEYFDFIIKYGSHGKWFDFNYDGVDYHVLPGCAHFLEHMLGEHSKYGNIYVNFANRGYYKNGGTSLDATHYFFKGTKDIRKSMRELIEAVELPVFTEEDVINTSYAIQRETAMTKDRPNSIQYALLNKNAFNNLYKIDETLSTIGNEETTKNLDYKTLKLCYDAFYHDENKVLVYAGSSSEEEIVSYIESIYENIPRHENKLTEKEYDYHGIRREYEEYIMNVKEDIHGCLFKTNAPDNFSRKEIQFITSIIAFSKFNSKSDLQIKLFSKGLVNRINSSGYNVDGDVIAFNISVYSDNIEEYISELKKELFVPVSEKEFNRMKKCCIASQARKYDDKIREFVTTYNRLSYSENFQEIDFFINLTYERYLEFVNSLKIEEQTRSRIKSK